MKNIFLLLILSFFALSLRAQENVNQPEASLAQPKIMVIPRVGSGQDMKALYDTSMNLQIALTKINEVFLKEGANLVSFDQVLKQATQNITLNRSSNNQEDYKSTVLGMSGADIYVEVKINVVRHEARGANSVTIVLDGYQTGTGNILGSKSGSSPINKTEDIGLLTGLAMETISTVFINQMRMKFRDIYENGQSIYVEFSLRADSKYDFDTEIGPQKKPFSEVIDDWLRAHAVKSVYNNQGVTANKIVISDMRIPLKNPANPQANYTGQNLYSELLKFFRLLNIPIKREIGTNNKILITIL
ncbi:MAG: DUF6175 family protein [Chitinophagaceae bacterium]